MSYISNSKNSILKKISGLKDASKLLTSLSLSLLSLGVLSGTIDLCSYYKKDGRNNQISYDTQTSQEIDVSKQNFYSTTKTQQPVFLPTTYTFLGLSGITLFFEKKVISARKTLEKETEKFKSFVDSESLSKCNNENE